MARRCLCSSPSPSSGSGSGSSHHPVTTNPTHSPPLPVTLLLPPLPPAILFPPIINPLIIHPLIVPPSPTPRRLQTPSDLPRQQHHEAHARQDATDAVLPCCCARRGRRSASQSSSQVLPILSLLPCFLPLPSVFSGSVPLLLCFRFPFRFWFSAYVSVS